MFYRALICVFLLSAFFTAKVLAVQAGELLWEVKKPGEAAPNYLMGSKHDVILNESSLPSEVISILEGVKVGLFEVISSELTEEALIEANKSKIKLPSGKTLSSYIGEEKTQKFFSALQSALSRLNEETVSQYSNEWKKLDINITSYKDFNSLRPAFVIVMIFQSMQLLQNQTVEEEAYIDNPNSDKEESDSNKTKPTLLTEDEEIFNNMSDSQSLEEPFVADKSTGIISKTEETEGDSTPDINTCLLQKEPMDTYIEKTLSCMKKPVHSLESIEEQMTALSSMNDDKSQAEMLDLISDDMIATLEGRLNETEKTVSDVSSFLMQLQMGVNNSIMNNYHQKLEFDTSDLKLSVQKEISSFLATKGCSSLPEDSINQYANQMVGFPELIIQAFLKGRQIEEEEEQKFAHIIREAGNRMIETISACFPDYIWPENMTERIEKGEKFLLDSLKKQIESLFLSRDQKMAQSMLPYFEEGGALAVVGFGHLSGVLEELKAQGYEIKNIELSKPLTLPESEYLKSEDKNDAPPEESVNDQGT